MSLHEEFMLKALELAREAGSLGEIPVGCVIVSGGAVVGSGFNRRETDKDALGHAELMAIKQACESLGSWRLTDASLYVTLEPCPMCAGAIINARIGHIIYGARDSKAGACGGVMNLFDYRFPHTPRLTGGVLEKESAELLSGFFKKLRR